MLCNTYSDGSAPVKNEEETCAAANGCVGRLPDKTTEGAGTPKFSMASARYLAQISDNKKCSLKLYSDHINRLLVGLHFCYHPTKFRLAMACVVVYGD
jgi:hypothetical protein